MTLNLNARDMKELEDLAGLKEMTKTAVIRNALQLYRVIDQRKREGARVFIQGSKDKKTELLVL